MRMTVGEIVDFCITYNEIHGLNEDEEETENKPKIRKATQSDWDAFWG